jgi:outer membrane receptor protein involved in Fe transport
VSDAQEAYINLDATVKFGPVDDDWYVEVYATNITDERVINWKGQGANGGWMSNSYNAPSMYGIRFNLAY